MSERPLSVGIIHQGEDVPSDGGYVPLRYGRLATDLTAAGVDVVRISPSFSHFRREQRNAGIEYSGEGTHLVVPTPGYDASVGRDRFDFTRQFIGATQRELRARTLDAVLVGVPPPGMVSATRAAIGPDVGLIADVRDLWPDAFGVGRSKAMQRTATAAGRVLSQELRKADAITAVTTPMLQWAPACAGPRRVIPIGTSARPIDEAARPKPQDPLQLCFVSNHAHGFDFAPVFGAWARYVSAVESGPPGSARPRLTFIGAEPDCGEQRRFATEEPTIELRSRVDPDEVASLLSGFDVGLAPATPAWGHSVGNKIFDYLSSGLFILHSMDPAASSEIDGAGLGAHCRLTESDWLRQLNRLHDCRAHHRATRRERIDLADDLFGPSATSKAFREVIDSVVADRDRHTRTDFASVSCNEEGTTANGA